MCVVNSLFVRLKIGVQGLDHLVESLGRQRFLTVIDFINQSLDKEWVSVACKQLFLVKESNVFKPVDFTKAPEHVIFIFSSSLNFELLGKVWVDTSSLIYPGKHIGLGERSTCINIKVVLYFSLGISSSSSVLKEPELADEVLIVQIDR